MELKLVTTDNKTKTVDLEKFLSKVHKDTFFYFSKETSYKDLQDLIDLLEKDGYAVYFREVKYTLEDDGYMYEMHIL
jgi:hypothetical protein